MIAWGLRRNGFVHRRDPFAASGMQAARLAILVLPFSPRLLTEGCCEPPVNDRGLNGNAWGHLTMRECGKQAKRGRPRDRPRSGEKKAQVLRGVPVAEYSSVGISVAGRTNPKYAAASAMIPCSQ